MNHNNQLKKIDIMLIDDDEFIRESLSFFFEDAGIHILALETAEEGLREIKIREFDVVIADYKLPGMDGIEFFEQIQKLNIKPIKFLITAYNNEEICTQAVKNGVRAIIEKPITSETLEIAMLGLLDIP